MIADGSIKVRQGEIAKFDGENVHFKDGSVEKYDVVVFATGYTGFPDTVKATIGEHWSTRFNPVWGLDEEGEIRSAPMICWSNAGQRIRSNTDHAS